MINEEYTRLDDVYLYVDNKHKEVKFLNYSSMDEVIVYEMTINKGRVIISIIDPLCTSFCDKSTLELTLTDTASWVRFDLIDDEGTKEIHQYYNKEVQQQNTVVERLLNIASMLTSKDIEGVNVLLSDGRELRYTEKDVKELINGAASIISGSGKERLN